MRYIGFGLAILAAVLALTIATSHLPRVAAASSDDTSEMVLQLEQSIDATALPRQDIPDEVYR